MIMMIITATIIITLSFAYKAMKTTYSSQMSSTYISATVLLIASHKYYIHMINI